MQNTIQTNIFLVANEALGLFFPTTNLSHSFWKFISFHFLHQVAVEKLLKIAQLITKSEDCAQNSYVVQEDEREGQQPMWQVCHFNKYVCLGSCLSCVTIRRNSPFQKQ